MGYFDLHKYIEGLSEEDLLRHLKSDGTKITKGSFDGFVDWKAAFHTPLLAAAKCNTQNRMLQSSN